MNALRLSLLMLGLTLLVWGCSSRPPRDLVEEAADGAPLKPITAEAVPDAEPRPDPILALGNQSPYTVNGVTYTILDEYQSYRERGIASWYGTKFNGRKTSNGEIFDHYAATAAHKTLPIPTYARVTNLDNGRSIVVRVNDRGPFHSERLIDLSYGAAVKLGYMERGTAPVEVEVLALTGVDDRRGLPAGAYRFLQLGAFGSRESAQRLRDELGQLTPAPVFLSEVESGGALLYRVRIGPLDDNEALLALRDELRANGYQGAQLLP